MTVQLTITLTRPGIPVMAGPWTEHLDRLRVALLDGLLDEPEYFGVPGFTWSVGPFEEDHLEGGQHVLRATVTGSDSVAMDEVHPRAGRAHAHPGGGGGMTPPRGGAGGTNLSSRARAPAEKKGAK